LSHEFICLGLLLGLLPGLCINTFLRFPAYPWTCGVVSSIHWILWLLQFCRGVASIKNVYKDFPGFGTVKQFFWGYVPLGPSVKLLPSDGDSLVFSRLSSKLSASPDGPTHGDADRVDGMEAASVHL